MQRLHTVNTKDQFFSDCIRSNTIPGLALTILGFAVLDINMIAHATAKIFNQLFVVHRTMQGPTDSAKNPGHPTREPGQPEGSDKRPA